MNFSLKILDIKSITSVEGYWTKDDYIQLLDAFDFGDAGDVSDAELLELLSLAITDFEPNEAAEIVLRYKLSEHLNKGQIENLSNEMITSNESEEYADIGLHFPLFNINQLLYQAYNGTFPIAKATKIEFELVFPKNPEVSVSKDLVLLAMHKILRKQNLILRLFAEELDGEKDFEEAEKIIWSLDQTSNNTYTLITSDNWINRDDFTAGELTDSIEVFEEH